MFARFAPKSSAVLALMLALGCRSMPEPAAPLTPPTQLCRQAQPKDGCRTTKEVEAWLRDPRLAVVGADDTPSGIQGARVLTLRTAGDHPDVFRAKWRPLSVTSDYNDPRREVAAYQVQKLFLDPHDYVVPPTAGHCFPLGAFQAQVDDDAESSFDGARCVYGVLSYWLEDVVPIDQVASEDSMVTPHGPLNTELFLSNATYRRSIGNVNLLTYMIDHGDTHPAQFLVSKRRHHAYVIDNSMAFVSPHNQQISPLQDWSHIRVTGVPADSLERIMGISRGQLDELLVLEEYENRDGQLVHVSRNAAGEHTGAGFRWLVAGKRLQMGLTKLEVELVWRKTQGLMALYDQGSIRALPR